MQIPCETFEENCNFRKTMKTVLVTYNKSIRKGKRPCKKRISKVFKSTSTSKRKIKSMKKTLRRVQKKISTVATIMPCKTCELKESMIRQRRQLRKKMKKKSKKTTRESKRTVLIKEIKQRRVQRSKRENKALRKAKNKCKRILAIRRQGKSPRQSQRRKQRQKQQQRLRQQQQQQQQRQQQQQEPQQQQQRPQLQQQQPQQQPQQQQEQPQQQPQQQQQKPQQQPQQEQQQQQPQQQEQQKQPESSQPRPIEPEIFEAEKEVEITPEEKEELIKSVLEDDDKDDDGEDEEDKDRKEIDVVEITNKKKQIDEIKTEIDFETITYEVFEEWITLIGTFEEMVDDIDEDYSTNTTTIQTLVDTIEEEIRTDLAKLFYRPTAVGRRILAQLFKFENLEENDDALRFIMDTSDDSDSDDDDDDKDDGDNENNDITDNASENKDDQNPEKPQIFDLNTMILCKKEMLEGEACTYVDVKKLCETNKAVNVAGTTIGSIFLPPGMYIRINRGKNEKPIFGLRGPFVWNGEVLFKSAQSIDVFTEKEFRELRKKMVMDGSDNYVINAVAMDESGQKQPTPWSNPVYKKNFCINSNKKRFYGGVKFDRKTLKVWVPEGATIVAAKEECNRKGKGGDYERFKGPKMIDFGQKEMLDFNKIIFQNAKSSGVSLPNANDDEVKDDMEADGEKVDGSNDVNNNNDEDEDDDDDDDEDDDGKMELTIGKDEFTGATIAELKENAKKAGITNLNSANVTIPSDTYLALTASSTQSSGEQCNALPPPIIYGETTMNFSELTKLVSDDTKLVDTTASSDDEGDNNDKKSQRKSFLQRYSDDDEPLLIGQGLYKHHRINKKKLSRHPMGHSQ